MGLEELLSKLRNALPKEYKIGAAVGGGDCFFDSVAQGLNELKDKGLIADSKGFSVKSLRKSCKQYAQVNQSKKGSWLDNALKGEGEKLHKYIHRIEFTAEDIENAIWGRPEVEGKMICEKYGIKIRIIELRDEEIDGLLVTKGKMGKDNTIYIVNYRNHFIPLLSNIEKDSREEVYGNVVSSNSNNISQSYISTPLQDIENSPRKQNGNENLKMSRKRRRSVTDVDDIAPKKLRLDSNDKLPDFNQEKISPQKQENSESFDMPTLESETAKGNYSYWLSDQDIRRVANVEYSDMYDIYIFSDNYENSAKGLAVISDQHLDSEIIRFKEIFHDDSEVISLRTFIINLRDSHWVTLVVSHRNGQYYGYYMDSLYDEDRAGNERNRVPDSISSILTNRDIKVKDLKTHQQDDGHNCGLFALENAKDINDVLRLSSVDDSEMLQRLQLPRDNYYFIKRRKYFTNKLNGNQRQMEDPASDLQTEIEERRAKDGKFLTGLQDSYDGLYGCDQYTFAKMRGYFNLVGITYQLQLLMLCFYRAFVVHKYDTLSLMIENVEFGQYDDIVLCDKNVTICIQIKYIDAEKAYNSIGFVELFPRGNRKWEGVFSINKYFNSFVQLELDNVEYLIICTNADLNLTKENKLKRSKWCVGFFPLKFDSIDIEEENYKILKDCLYAPDSAEKHGFYQFSREKATRRELFKLLDSTMRCNANRLKKLKKSFLDKVIFAVNQPCREKLNSIIKNEIKENDGLNRVSHIYNELREGMLRYITNLEGICITRENMGIFLKYIEASANMQFDNGILKQSNESTSGYKKAVGLRNYTPHIMYKLEFLMFCLYRIYQHKDDKLFISAESGTVNIASNICFHYENKIIYIWIKYGPEGHIDYSRLFPNRQKKRSEVFSINKYFSYFIKQLSTEIEKVEHLVIYTNMGLDLTKKGELEDVPIRFNEMDIKNHQVLRDYMCADDSTTFYQFSSDKTTRRKLLKLLDPWPFEYDTEGLKEMKRNFLDKLVFAVNQPDREKLSSIIKREIEENNQRISQNKVLRKYIALQEVVLRWIDAYKVHYITRKRVGKLFEDIKNDKSSDQNVRIPDKSKDQFIKTIIADRGLCHFREFREFLDTKEGVDMLDVLNKNGAEGSMSGILLSIGIGVIDVFRRLFHMLFDKDGEKTDFLKSLMESGITLSNISNILHGAGNKGPEALEELHTVLNTKLDDGKTYLELFVEKKVMGNMSSILHGTGTEAPKVLKALYTILSAKLDGEKTYLEFFVEKKIMGNISSMLTGVGGRVPEALEVLYAILNTKLENGKTYLEFFVEKKIMRNISSMLSGAGYKALEALKELYTILNTKLDNGKTYLEFFVEKNIMKNISSMLSRVGDKAPEALKELYTILNTKLDNRKTYLEFFVEGNIMENISSMLNGAGNKAPEALKGLYTMLNTKLDDGKTYLEFFIEKNIMKNISSILSGTGSKAPRALKALFTMLNTKLDNGKTYLEFFVENKVMVNVSSMLGGMGPKAPKALKELYTILSTKLDGEQKTYLEFFIEKNVMKNISSILHRARGKTSNALKALRIILITKLDNGKTYLEFFVENDIMKNISSILHGAGNRASEALEELYTILSMKLDNGKTYLEFFVQEKIMGNVSSILHGAGGRAPEALKALYTVLNTKLADGKTYLEFFVEKNIMKNISSMLSGTGGKAPEALKELHAVLNTKLDNGKTYLEFFVEKNIMGNISSMLNRSGHKAPEVLKALHIILNAKLDNGKTYLEFFAEKKIMGNVSSILHGAGGRAPEALKGLYTMLNTKIDDGKTYLEFFVEKNIMKNVSSMLSGTGGKAPEALKELYTMINMELDDGKTYLDFFVERKIMGNMSSMLNGAGNKAPGALLKLHHLLFNEKYLEHFIKEGFNLNNLSGMLHGTKAQAPHILKRVHNLCFDIKGNKTSYFSDLINENHKSAKLFNILHKIATASSLDEQNISEGEETTNDDPNSDIAAEGQEIYPQNNSAP